MTRTEDLTAITESLESIADSLKRIADQLSYQSELKGLEAVRNGHPVSKPPR